MFRIRKLTDTVAPANRRAIEEVQAITREQFPGIREADIAKLPDWVADPLKHSFVTEIHVAEGSRGQVRGFTVVMRDHKLRFAYLDLISTRPGGRDAGLGGAMYERVREEIADEGLQGLYFECLPDDPALSPNPQIRRQNIARLKFYERFGARPIIGSAYETPVNPGDADPPLLMFDGLGQHDLPQPATLKQIVRALLERKYGQVCSPEYIAHVVDSIGAQTALRPPKYAAKADAMATTPAPLSIPLVVNDRHDIHHIRERGYVEAPVRVASILAELDKTGLFRHVAPKHFGDRHIQAVHDGGLVDYVERACAEAPEGKSVYPYVFPIRNANRRPRERSVLAGYWCIDTFTPLNRAAYPAARRAVDCALTAADLVADGAQAAYALVRPPGHHAERRAFGGFCYFNNAAIAAHYLSQWGRVAVLDVDYHHGNGTQDIFYERADVLTVSVHGHPSFAYPYFSGFRNETGRGAGAGHNLNLPLPETITAEEHRDAVRTGLRRIERHDPAYLVVALGLDPAKGDPTGTWPYVAADFARLGEMIANAGLPTVVVQEGGYRVRTLGSNAAHFFTGLAKGLMQPRPPRRPRSSGRALDPGDIQWRESAQASDMAAVRDLAAGAGVFSSAEVDIAVELVEERITKGRLSGYEFIFAESGANVVGYACYGPTPATEATWDLYWIVVAPAARRLGLGRALLDRTMAAIARRGGTSIYVDTSSTDVYDSTRAFYRRMGFRKLVELPDFYKPGDNKVIYRRDVHDDSNQHPQA